MATYSRLMTGDVFGKWRNDLQAWAIPEPILAQAPESPWIHPVENFTPRGDLHVGVPSRLRALEALPAGGSVLDVGCGGGRSSIPLVPPANELIGVDRSGAMLDAFVDAARIAGVARRTVHGAWPDVAGHTPHADVVICHHVLYDVGGVCGLCHHYLCSHLMLQLRLHHLHPHSLCHFAFCLGHLCGDGDETPLSHSHHC